jgi:hypothetical protein
MIPLLTPEGYAQTKSKLADMKVRLAALQARDDLSPLHKQEAERSYHDMMRQYLRDIKLYETANGIATASQAVSRSPQAAQE